jgi:Fe(3+) dicitrate transport protein
MNRLSWVGWALAGALCFVASTAYAQADASAVEADAGAPEDDESAEAEELDGGEQVDAGAEADVAANEDAGAFDPFVDVLPPEGAATAKAEPSAPPPPDQGLFRVNAVDVVGTLDADVAKAPSSAYVLDEKRLGVFKQDDALQILTQVPGVYVRQEDGYGLRPNIGMRGADSDRSKKVTLMEDGVLFGPAPYSAPAAYYFPLMTRMTGVEVYKGASAIRFGPQTIGGALDLRTREIPDKGPVAAVDGSFGNTFYTKAHAYGGYGWERAGFLAEGASISSTGFKQLDGGGDTGFSKQEFMLKGRINSDPDAHVYQRLEGKVGYTREESHETYLGLTDQDFRDNPVRRYKGSQLDDMQNWRTQGELFHTLGVGEHFQLDSALYRHDFNRLWKRVDGLISYSGVPAPPLLSVLRSPSAYQQQYDVLRGVVDSDTAGTGILQAGNKRRMVSEGFQTVARYDFVTGEVKHVLELGLRMHYDEIKRHHSAHGFDMVAERDDSGAIIEDAYHLVSNGQQYGLLANNHVTTYAVAAHLKYDVTYKRLTLSPGMRTEIIRATYTELNEHPYSGMPLASTDVVNAKVGHKTYANNQTVLFALGALYQLTDTVALLAGVQQGMTPVAPSPGTTNDDPERATNYEAGARYTDKFGTASAVGFVSDYNKIVAPCDENCTSGDVSTYSGGKALVYGVELGSDYTVALPRAFRVPVRAAYTYTHAEFTEGFGTNYEPWGGVDNQVDAHDGIPYIAPHQFSLGSGLSWRDRVGLDAQVTFVDHMLETAGQGNLAANQYTDRYALLDVAVFYQALAKLRIYVKGDNLTNNQPIVARRPFGARPNKPLLVQAGFVWNL